MRIVFVAPFGMGQKTTVWARILPLATQLVLDVHKVQLVVPPWDCPEEGGTVLHHQGVPIHRVSIRGGLGPTLLRMQRHIQAFRADVIHIVKPRAHAGLCQFLAVWQRRLTLGTRPLLLLDADDWEQAWTPQLRAGPVPARFLAWQEEWGLRHCDGVTVASQWLWRRVQAYAPRVPRLYLPNGSDPQEQGRASVSPARPVILWITRFVETTPAWMADFWTALRKGLPGCRLWVVGAPIQTGLDLAFRNALQADTQGALDIEWMGYVERDRLKDLYARASCTIAPARESAANLAKCSVRMLDSVHFGLHCIASRVGEQTRFGQLPHVSLVSSTATAAEFAAAVARAVRRQGQMPQPYAHQDIVPAWSMLAHHLAQFYRHLHGHSTLWRQPGTG